MRAHKYGRYRVPREEKGQRTSWPDGKSSWRDKVARSGSVIGTTYGQLPAAHEIIIIDQVDG